MATQQVGSLIISLEARTAQIQQDMAQTKRIVGDAMGSVRDDSKRAADALERLADEGGAASSVLDGLKSAVGAVGIGTLVSQLAAAERQFGGMNVQLQVATGSAGAAALQFSKLQVLGDRLALPVEGLTAAYVKLKNLGLDPGERSLVSYANTAAASNKTLTDMIEAVADATTGEFERLKEFGIKSKVEGDQVAFTFQGVTSSIQNSSGAINQYLTAIGENQYAGAQELKAKTLEGALQQLQNRVAAYYRQVNEEGAGQAMIQSTQFLADHLGEAAAVAGVLASVLAGRVASSMAASAAATLSAVSEKRASAVASAQLAASELVLAERHRELAMLELSRARMLGVATVATEAAAMAVANHARALVAHEAAQLASTRAASALGGAVGLLGGPIGVVTTALSLGAVAWSIWGGNAQKAVSTARDELARLNKEKQFGAGSVGIFNEGIAENNSKLKALQANRLRVMARGEDVGGIDAEISKLNAENAQFAKQAKAAAAAQLSLNTTVKAGSEEALTFLSRRQQKEREIAQVQADFNKATVGRALTLAQLQELAVARAEKLADIEKRYSTSTATRGGRAAQYGSTEDRELADLRARILTENQLAVALVDYGEAVDKITPGQKLLNQLHEQEAVAKTAVAKAHIQAKITLAEELVTKEKANIQTKAGLQQAAEERKAFFADLNRDVEEYERAQMAAAQRLRDLYETPYQKVQRESAGYLRDIDNNRLLSAPEQAQMRGAEVARAEQATRQLQYGVQQDLGMVPDAERIVQAHRDMQRRIAEVTAEGTAERVAMEIAATRKLAQDIEAMESQKVLTVLGMSRQVFDGMAGLAETAAGRQSAAYKLMFLASKAVAFGEAIVNTNVAYTAALKLTPAYAETIRGLGYASAGIIAAQAIQGMAHDGIDSIPREGTWLLDRGERVVDARTNADLKQYLQQKNGGGGGGISVVINDNVGVQVRATEGVGADGQPQLTLELVERVAGTVFDRKLARELRPGGVLNG